MFTTSDFLWDLSPRWRLRSSLLERCSFSHCQSARSIICAADLRIFSGPRSGLLKVAVRLGARMCGPAEHRASR